MEGCRGGERGLGTTPCSLANAQRAFWGGGGRLGWRRKRRSERSDSRQVRKRDRALKRGRTICQEKRSAEEEEAKIGGKSTLAHTKHRVATLTPLNTPHPLVICGCRRQGRGLHQTQEWHWPRQAFGRA